MIAEIPVWALTIAWIVVAIAALTQATIGFGFNILAVPLMSLIHPDLAPNPQLVITAVLSAATVIRERGRFGELKDVAYVLAGRPVGGLAGLAVIGLATAFWLDVSIGVIVLVAVAILSTNITIVRTPVTESLAGFASGFTSIVSSIGGPPLILLYRDETGKTTRSQLGIVFLIGALISIGLRSLGGEFGTSDLVIGLSMLPPMFLGFSIAGPARSKIDRRGLRTPVLVMSSLAALSLIGRALLDL